MESQNEVLIYDSIKGNVMVFPCPSQNNLQWLIFSARSPIMQASFFPTSGISLGSVQKSSLFTESRFDLRDTLVQDDPLHEPTAEQKEVRTSCC